MKKFTGVLLLSLILLSFLPGFVVAAEHSFGSSTVTSFAETVSGVLDDVYTAIRPLLEGIVGDTPTGDLFLAKVLFFLIILGVIWIALDKVSFFGEHPFVLWVVTIAVSILAVRWVISNQIVETAILPYSALGIAISAGIPFILYFFVVKDLGKTMRKVAWIFFALIFFALYIWRIDDVYKFAWIYLATAGAAVLVLLFDGTIHDWMVKARVERTSSSHANTRAANLIDLREKVMTRFARDGDNYNPLYGSGKGEKAYRSDLRKIDKRIAKLTR